MFTCGLWVPCGGALEVAADPPALEQGLERVGVARRGVAAQPPGAARGVDPTRLPLPQRRCRRALLPWALRRRGAPALGIPAGGAGPANPVAGHECPGGWHREGQDHQEGQEVGKQRHYYGLSRGKVLIPKKRLKQECC